MSVNLKKYKIAFPHLSFRHHGGTKIFLEIANELCKNHSVELIAPSGYIDTPFTISDSISINEIKVPFKNKYVRYVTYLLILIVKLCNYKLIVNTSPIVYYSAFVASLFSRCKYLYIVQGIENIYSKKSLRRFFNLPIVLTYKSQCIIAANEYLKEIIEIQFKNRLLFYFNVWLSDEFFTVTNESSRQHDIIYFPRKEAWKGLHSFLELLSVAREKYKVLLVSQDEILMNEVKSTLQSFHHEITTCKPSSIVEVIHCYDSSKILFFTSTTEGFALPPLEAMARGVPPVLYPSGGPSVYAKDKTNCRYYCHLSEAETIINDLLSNEQERLKLSQNGLLDSKKFCKQIELKKVVDFINNSISGE